MQCFARNDEYQLTTANSKLNWIKKYEARREATAVATLRNQTNSRGVDPMATGFIRPDELFGVNKQPPWTTVATSLGNDQTCSGQLSLHKSKESC